MYIWYKNDMNFKKDHSLKMLVNSAITSFFDFAWYVGFLIGVSMTITSHAQVLSSSTGIYYFVFSIIV